MAEPPVQQILNMQKRGMNDAEIIRQMREQGYSEKNINDALNQAKIKSSMTDTSPQIPQTNTHQLPELPQVAPPSPAIPQAPPETPQTEEPYPQAQAPVTEKYEQSYPADYQEQGYSEEGYRGQGERYGEGYAPQEYTYPTEAVEEIAESIIEEKWQDFSRQVGDIKLWKESMEKDIKRVEAQLENMQDSINKIQAALLGKVQEYGKNISGLGADVKAMEKAFSQIIGPLTENVRELDKVLGKLKGKRTKKK